MSYQYGSYRRLVDYFFLKVISFPIRTGSAPPPSSRLPAVGGSGLTIRTPTGLLPAASWSFDTGLEQEAKERPRAVIVKSLRSLGKDIEPLYAAPSQISRTS